jgi:hypothetical protein
MSLKDRAAELARGDLALEPVPADPPPLPPAAPLEDPGIPEPPAEGPPEIPVHTAWSRVMGTVRGVGKDQRVTEGPAKFQYRGIDDALNVFGPACRLHGVLVLPVHVETAYRDTKTSTGKPTRECTVVVTYRIIRADRGPHGGRRRPARRWTPRDKGTAKAQAVALRTLLFHGGLVMTGDEDPDARNLERGEAAVRPAASYRDEALDHGTSRQRMGQIVHELRQHGMYGATVMNENGDDEAVGELVMRLGRERFTPGGE